MQRENLLAYENTCTYKPIASIISPRKYKNIYRIYANMLWKVCLLIHFIWP